MLAPIILGDVYKTTRRKAYTHDEARLDRNLQAKLFKAGALGPGEKMRQEWGKRIQ